MADSPFSNPEIVARIAADVARIQSDWLDWNAEPTTCDFDTKIVETLVKALDAHARGYLEAIDGTSQLPEYHKLLRRVGSAQLENAKQRSFLSDPYSEDRLRQIAETTWHIVRRRHELTSERYEAEIRAEVERCRSKLMPEALKWLEWKTQLLIRIETRFEARYRHWAAEAIERAQQGTKSLETNGTSKRLRATVFNKFAARRMEAYMESHGGQTAFATKVGTTDRTLRSFRKTGRVRLDIFKAIAGAMGTTPDELLKPE
jgi:hypothetical protein